MESITRRELLKYSLLGFTAISGLSLLNSCGGKKENQEAQTPTDPCQDLKGVDEAQIAIRKNYNYVPKSTTEGQSCTNCNFYKIPEGNNCGGCQLFAGPVTPNGWCKTWIVKAS